MPERSDETETAAPATKRPVGTRERMRQICEGQALDLMSDLRAVVNDARLEGEMRMSAAELWLSTMDHLKEWGEQIGPDKEPPKERPERLEESGKPGSSRRGRGR